MRSYATMDETRVELAMGSLVQRRSKTQSVCTDTEDLLQQQQQNRIIARFKKRWDDFIVLEGEYDDD